MLRSISLLAAATLAACVAPDADDSFGQIDLALVGQAENGSTYRLRDASIAVAGPTGTLTFATEDDPDRTAITQRLATGTYALELGGSWHLERLDGATATPVAATLLSSNPQSFTIDADALTRVSLRFGVPGGEVGLGEGDLEIGVDVDVLPERMSVVLEPHGFQVDEGQNLVLGVRLSHRPAATTTVTVVTSDAAALFVSPDTLTFTPDTWSVAQLVSLQAPLDADTAGASVTVTAILDAATASQMTVQVIDTDFAAIGWPTATPEVLAIPPIQVTLYRVATGQPFDVRRLQITAGGPGPVFLGIYADDGSQPGQPDLLALAAPPVILAGMSEPTVSDLGGSALLPAGTYWLAVATNGSLSVAAGPSSSGTVRRCRATYLGGGLPGSLAGSGVSCGQAPPIAIAALGHAL